MLYWTQGNPIYFKYRPTFGTTRLDQDTALAQIEDSARAISVMERRSAPGSTDNNYGFWIQSGFSVGNAGAVNPGTNVRISTSNGQPYFNAVCDTF